MVYTKKLNEFIGLFLPGGANCWAFKIRFDVLRLFYYAKNQQRGK
jgi:hypothetical protein